MWRAAGFNPSGLAFTLITSSNELLPTFPSRMRQRFARAPARAGHPCRTPAARHRRCRADACSSKATAGRLDEVFWTTRAAPGGVAAQRPGLPSIRRLHQGDETLQSSRIPMFSQPATSRHRGPRACPSPASTPCAPARRLPGICVACSRASACGAYRPQREALYLISTGERYALGARNGLTFEGAWVWKLKDFIDRRFMAKFNELPEMPQTASADSSADRRSGGDQGDLGAWPCAAADAAPRSARRF